jgi:PAS domain S-box-containing protein
MQKCKNSFFRIEFSHIIVAVGLFSNALFFTSNITSIVIQVVIAIVVLFHNLDDKKIKDRVLTLIKELMYQRDYTNTLIESNETAIIAIDSSSKILTFNKKAQKIFGYKEDEMVDGDNLHKIIPDNYIDLHNKASSNFFATGIPKGILNSTQSLFGKRKDGNIFPIDISFGVSNSKENTIVVASITDTTKEHKADLEQIRLLNEIELTQKEIIYKMGSVVEGRSLDTAHHVNRVANASELLALLYGIGEHEAAQLKLASPMHDVGKVSIPDNILNKPALLNDDEYKVIKKHAQNGYNMLKGSQRTLLKIASIVAHQHHERWDGKGYPQGLKGEQIHIYGRITAIIDVYDALSHERVYKKPWDRERIIQLYKQESGKQFDPKLTELFLEHFEEFEETMAAANNT